MSPRALGIGAVLVLAAACASAPAHSPLQSPVPTAAPADSPAPPALSDPTFSVADWGYAVEEAAVESLMQRASHEHHAEALVFDHVTLVSMSRPASEPDRRVVVDRGEVVAIGPAATTPAPPGARFVDGRGRWLLPGLVDMHVHTVQSSSSYLLDLANGVTSVREMAGFPWLLAMRAEARAQRMLVPNLYVAGHILNGEPMEWYAQVVTTPEQARVAVLRQASQGYEFIKVHNMVRPEVFDAICDEARKHRIDVVGHVPHDVTVARAIACPMRTMEHFKGYLLDASLTLSTEDYVAATRGEEVWNTPTFYNWREATRGDEAHRLLALPEMRYIPRRRLAQWSALADEKPDPAQQRVLGLEEKIFRDLLPIHAHFLAGTDSGGGYAYQVRGFALHEELARMQRLGLSPYDTLRTATVEPGRAMRREGELGLISIGRRADLVLTDADPLKSVASTEREHIEGVVVRGVWLPRETLASLLDEVAAIYGRGAEASLTRAEVEAAVATFARLRDRGWPLRSHMLRRLRDDVKKARIAVDESLFLGIDEPE